LVDFNDIDSSVEYLTKSIILAMDESIPKKCFTSKNNFSQHLKDCIAKKKRLRRAYFRHKLKDPVLKMEIDRVDLSIRNSIDARDSEILMKKLKQIRPDNKMFKNISKLLGNGQEAVPALKALDGSLISNPFDKANAIAKVYSEIHTQNRDMGDQDFDLVVTSQVNSFSQTITPNMFKHRLTDADEIRQVLKTIKSKKSNGPDGIPNTVLKKLPRSAHDFLAKLINCILTMGYYPNSWKEAHVIPILKPGKPANEANNYRPISLLNNLSKVLEKILHARILDYCNDKDLLPNNQFGFRNKHSTVHALMRLFEEATIVRSQ